MSTKKLLRHAAASHCASFIRLTLTMINLELADYMHSGTHTPFDLTW